MGDLQWNGDPGYSSRLYSEQLPPEKVQSVIVEPAKEIELAIRTAEAKGEENSKPQSEQKSHGS